MAQIVPKFKALADVTGVLRHLGLDRCSLVVGIDFTASNIKQGMPMLPSNEHSKVQHVYN